MQAMIPERRCAASAVAPEAIELGDERSLAGALSPAA